MIFERLQEKQMYMDSTVEHLEDFAKEGKLVCVQNSVPDSAKISMGRYIFNLLNWGELCSGYVEFSVLRYSLS